MVSLEMAVALLKELAAARFSGLMEVEFRNGCVLQVNKAVPMKGAPPQLETRQGTGSAPGGPGAVTSGWPV